MKPSGQAYCTYCRYQRVSNSRPRNHSQAPTKPMSSISTPMPTMTRKEKNTGNTGGRSFGGEILEALEQAVSAVREDQARAVRDGDLEVVALLLLVRDGEQHERARL